MRISVSKRRRLPSRATAGRQRGATLLIGLVMLVLLTLMALSAIRSSSINLQIAGNQQYQNEAWRAAEQAVEEVLSNTMTTLPETRLVDIDGDGVPDHSVSITKACIGSALSANTSLSAAGIFDSVWELTATVTDSRTGAHVVVHRGARVIAGGACT